MYERLRVFPELARMDDRFLSYVAALPSPLNRVGLECQTYSGFAEAGMVESLVDIHPVIAASPWMFPQGPGRQRGAEHMATAEAVLLYTLAGIIVDHCMDQHAPKHAETLLLAQWFQVDAIRSLTAIFPPESIFWRYFETFRDETVRAHAYEIDRLSGPSADYTVEQMRRVGCGKSALLKLMPAALAVQADHISALPAIGSSIDSVAAAIQLLDDVLDWEEDYRLGRCTLPLVMLIPADKWRQPTSAADWERLRCEHGRVGNALLVLAGSWMQDARSVAADLGCPMWQACLDDFDDLIRAVRRRLVAETVATALRAATGGDDGSTSG